MARSSDAPKVEPIAAPRVLLVGPFDPMCGEFTFLSPPLGVWRLAGVLQSRGIRVAVFDPNCCSGVPEEALEEVLRSESWHIIGFSTTGMTLKFDLALAHAARRLMPNALLIAGGMEATFNPEIVLKLGPFDLVVLGEGERPLIEIVENVRLGAALNGVAGTAYLAGGEVRRLPQRALTREELRDAIFRTPYDLMPYRRYWDKLEEAYRIGELPVKADREARLAEIRSIRLVTLNYCPMGCTFCSSTNFLNEAQGSTARIARLDADECLHMIRQIVTLYPDVRTIIFQDDIFVFTSDQRLGPLCEAIMRAKVSGDIPSTLQFISTNRIDAMTSDRLQAMRRAGFRTLGFGVENFAPNVLAEFNKKQIYPFIDPILSECLTLGITPFLDMILTSPRCRLPDLAHTIRCAYKWTLAGCEVGMYPYVIPFSGSRMAADLGLVPYTVMMRQKVLGTDIEWDQPNKILPCDQLVRETILTIEHEFNLRLEFLERHVTHLASRVRSLIWVVSAIPVLSQRGFDMPNYRGAIKQLVQRLPGVRQNERQDIEIYLGNGLSKACY